MIITSILLPAFNLLKANWKLVLIVLLLVGVYFYHTSAVKSAYKNGIQTERSAWEEKVKAEDEENRKYEKIVQEAVDLYGKKLLDASEKRIVKEKEYHTSTETIIKDNPIYQQCVADKTVIDNINGIRKLGPTK